MHARDHDRVTSGFFVGVIGVSHARFRDRGTRLGGGQETWSLNQRFALRIDAIRSRMMRRFRNARGASLNTSR